MPSFRELDLYRLDDLLTEEERAVRDTVRGWVEDRAMPRIRDLARDGTFPLDLVPEMGRLGFLGAAFPDYGCAGLSQVAYGLILHELERCDSGLRSFASVQGSLVMFPIREFGTEAQKDRWLARLRAGDAVGCFGLTEAGHGSDPGGMETRAEPDGDGWILHGAKMWITNGEVADIAVVWARTPDGVQGFLVERGTPGYATSAVRHKWSLRASVTSELLFDRCRLGPDAILPGAKGLRAALQCLNQARYGISWGAIGAAQACYDEALRYALERHQFDRPLASFQLVQQKLAWMATEITKGQLLAWRLGRIKEEGAMRHWQVSLAKRNNVAVALEIARAARDILGAAGITDEYATGRHLCNLESVYTYEGTHDIHGLALGAALTGVEAFR